MKSGALAAALLPPRAPGLLTMPGEGGGGGAADLVALQPGQGPPSRLAAATVGDGDGTGWPGPAGGLPGRPAGVPLQRWPLPQGPGTRPYLPPPRDPGMLVLPGEGPTDLVPIGQDVPQVAPPKRRPAGLHIDDVRRSARPWLELERPSQWLESTDLGSGIWVGLPGRCSSNVTRPDAPWLHPQFQFKRPVRAVRIRLTRTSDKKKLWDVIFSGRPGSDYSIPNTKVPSGGLKPVFPEFCPPLSPNAAYELRLTDEANLGGPRRFDELLRLRPRRGQLREVEGPRPQTRVEMEDGAWHQGMLARLDPETGLRVAQSFL